MTAFGRMMIERTKELVELKYTVDNGYKADAKVNLDSIGSLTSRNTMLQTKMLSCDDLNL